MWLGDPSPSLSTARPGQTGVLTDPHVSLFAFLFLRFQCCDETVPV